MAPEGALSWSLSWVERGLVPDAWVRWGIRRLLRERLAECSRASTEAFVASLGAAPIALLPELANDQHYEIPPAFFREVLGPRLKYSACEFPPGITRLGEAERCMLTTTTARADVRPGMRVLDLGCGWGSLSLWLAEFVADLEIVAVSNSKAQREWILGEARRRGLPGVRVVTADMNEFEPSERFDRVVSVEMFEHMRGWPKLLGRIRDWLLPEGRAFLHVFCHREHAYPYEVRSASDWMSRHFFSGGMMPSADLIERFDADLAVEQRWEVSGTHYRDTAEAWLANLDERRDAVWAIFAQTYGEADAARWVQRWRLFFMACAELFGYANGREWFVSQYRLR